MDLNIKTYWKKNIFLTIFLLFLIWLHYSVLFFLDVKNNSDLSTKSPSFWSNLYQSLPAYKQGFLTTLLLAIDGLFLGFLLAILLTMWKNSSEGIKRQKTCLIYLQKILTVIFNFLMNFFKAIPIVIQALLFYSFLVNMPSFKGSLGPVIVGLIVIMLNTAFNLTEIMLNHIKFLDHGQIEAAYSLGMNQKQVFRYITLGQTFKRTIPSVWNQFIINLKETALFQIIGVVSLIFAAQRQVSITFDTITPYLLISLFYLMLVGMTDLINQKTKH
ncbi:amino acid ABC transporter permease [Vaccinium witches'-broom phytoplasma]|uniref:amino acid ABC transporter permease n=1 Tax=Vaccinium witches'-broom phytoplasma TaxID=85642 RepID=UPI000380410F|nr:ABC transporter permease subunit [Vaccinium witches'-broom phytoplasma]